MNLKFDCGCFFRTEPFVLICALAACGGSAQIDTGPPAPSKSASEQRLGRAQLLAEFTNPISYTSLASLPKAGTSIYTGYFYGNFSNSSDSVIDRLTADLEISISFTASSAIVTGRADNFFDSSDIPMSGHLDLTAGFLDRAGNPNDDATFEALAGGLLTQNSGQEINLRTLLEGDFLGVDHHAIGGAVFGRGTVNGESQDFDGGFITKR